METQGRYESKAQGLLILIRVAEGDRHGRHLSRGKDSKTLVLAAFFGYFLPLLAESTPPEAYDNRRKAPVAIRFSPTKSPGAETLRGCSMIL